MIVQFRNEKDSNHGSIPITIDCNVVAFIVFEEGFQQPIKRTKHMLRYLEMIGSRERLPPQPLLLISSKIPQGAASQTSSPSLSHFLSLGPGGVVTPVTSIACLRRKKTDVEGNVEN
ncbi:hypothetical protein TNCV_3691921 [Trichonephila clavipes]|nr:hypothetical protein TNCV_3691921 [Trichonephila clavipes]